MVYALPFVAAALVTFGGFILGESRENTAEAKAAVTEARAEMKAAVQVVSQEVAANKAAAEAEQRIIRESIERRMVIQEEKVGSIDRKVDAILREVRK